MELAYDTVDPDHQPFIRSETDLAIFVIIVITNLVCTTAIFVAYHRKHQEFNDYLDDFADIPVKFMMDKCDKGKSVTRIYFTYGFIFILNWILCFFTSFLVTKESWVKIKLFATDFWGIENGSDASMWIPVFLTFLGYIFIYASPLQFGTDILVDIFLQSNGILFGFWKMQLIEEREKVK